MKIGSKVQVFRGNADQTASGLKKKDLVRVRETMTVDGKRKVIYRYRSKKQQKKGKQVTAKSQKARAKWTNALKKARKELLKTHPDSKGTLVLVLNPRKKYSKLKLKKKQKLWGNFLYKKTKEFYK